MSAKLLTALIGAFPLALFDHLTCNAEVRAAGGVWIWDVQATFEVSGPVLYQIGGTPTELADQVEAHLMGATGPDPIVGSVTVDARGRGRAVFSWETEVADTDAPPRPFLRVQLAILPTVEGQPADAGVAGGGLAFSRVAGAVAVVPLPFTEAPVE